MNNMTLETEADMYVIVTRRFAASPEAVYRAHTDPELVQQWMLGPEGWTMPVCINEAKPGGKIRYEWANGKGGGFYLSGEFLELEPYGTIVPVDRARLAIKQQVGILTVTEVPWHSCWAPSTKLTATTCVHPGARLARYDFRRTLGSLTNQVYSVVGGPTLL